MVQCALHGKKIKLKSDNNIYKIQKFKKQKIKSTD